MLKLLGVYVVVTVTMLVLDLVWLRGIATSWYEEGLRHLMAPKPDLKAAGVFYLLYPLGLVIFGVLPNEDSTLLRAVGMGALFGFFAYATYDLSNLATLRDWPLNVSLMDMAWGTLASGLSVGAGKLCLDALRR
jgi:uncharacterized membrane protein